MPLYFLDYNSDISWWIFTTLRNNGNRMNTVRTSYKIFNFILTVPVHYLVKLSTT